MIKKYIKIKFNLDGDLLLNKTLELCNIVIVVRSVFHECNKYYPQVFEIKVCINQLRNNDSKFNDSIMMLRHCQTKLAKEECYVVKSNKYLGYLS